jgi:hypothetical protein
MSLTRTCLMSLRRTCLAASAVLCFAGGPAAAQYNIFDSQFGTYTDVIINGRPEGLDSVREFEQRCQIRAEAGQWSLDQNGNFGPVGGPAIYNVKTCRALIGRNGPENDFAQGRNSRTEGRCTFFSGGGSICSGPGWGTVNPN